MPHVTKPPDVKVADKGRGPFLVRSTGELPPWERVKGEEATLRQGPMLANILGTRAGVGALALGALLTIFAGASAAVGGPKELIRIVENAVSMTVGEEAKNAKDPLAAQLEKNRKESDGQNSAWAPEESTVP